MKTDGESFRKQIGYPGCLVRILMLILLGAFILNISCGSDWLVNRHKDIMEETDNFGGDNKDDEG